MLFAAYKNAVLSAIDRVSKVVKSNPRSVDILQCVKIDTNEFGVFLTATSPMASVRVKVHDAKTTSEDSVVVNVDKLRDRISKAGDMVRVESSGNTLNIVSNDNQRLGISILKVSDFPKIRWSQDDESYGLNKENVVNLLSMAANLTSGITALTPAFLQVKIEDERLFVASDVMYHKFPIECNPALLSAIPTSTIPAVISFLKATQESRVWISQLEDSETVTIVVGDDAFQTVPLALRFPNVDPVFEKVRIAASEELNVRRKDLISSLAKAKTSVDTYGVVNIRITGTAMTTLEITARNERGDFYEDKVPALWSGSGDGRSLRFNLDSIVNFLNTFDSEDIKIRLGEDFRGDLSPAYCQEGDHSGILNQFRV